MKTEKLIAGLEVYAADHQVLSARIETVIGAKTVERFVVFQKTYATGANPHFGPAVARPTVESHRIVLDVTHAASGRVSTVSTQARIIAHWDGFCAAHGARAVLAVGQAVLFRRSSFGMWPGVVTSSSATSCVVSYRTRKGFEQSKRVKRFDIVPV